MKNNKEFTRLKVALLLGAALAFAAPTAAMFHTQNVAAAEEATDYTEEETTDYAEEGTAVSNENEQDPEDDDQLYSASFSIQNNLNSNIKAFYFALDSDDEWGENKLSNGYELEAGELTLFDGSVNYTPSSNWSMKIITDDGDQVIFDDIVFSNLNNHEKITITLSEEDDVFYYEVN